MDELAASRELTRIRSELMTELGDRADAVAVIVARSTGALGQKIGSMLIRDAGTTAIVPGTSAIGFAVSRSALARILSDFDERVLALDGVAAPPRPRALSRFASTFEKPSRQRGPALFCLFGDPDDVVADVGGSP